MGENRKILVVDDEIFSLKLVKRVLQKEGYEVTLAPSGQRGLELIDQSSPFAAVICDYRMPVMDGVQFFDALKEKSPHTATIMISALEKEEIPPTSSMNYYLQKPVPDNALLETVNQARDKFEEELKKSA